MKTETNSKQQQLNTRDRRLTCTLVTIAIFEQCSHALLFPCEVLSYDSILVVFTVALRNMDVDV